MSKAFWRNSRVGVIGAGSWGTVLAQICSENSQEVILWTRSEEGVRQMAATRHNPEYVSHLRLNENIVPTYELSRVFEKSIDAIVWALPSKATRPMAKEVAEFISGNELILHATKGVEQGTLKRVTHVLEEELPLRRFGVISGPNLATEVADGKPAATVVASNFPEVVEAGIELLSTEKFRVYGHDDVAGVEWAGVLKNILAIASGALDHMDLGWNARAMLISRGLAEMVRFGLAMGAREETFLGLAGVGDMLATCSSPLSRNYQVGFRLAQGKKLDDVLEELGQTAEGVATVQYVWNFAKQRGIRMPITEAVYHAIKGDLDARDAIKFLMQYPRDNA